MKKGEVNQMFQMLMTLIVVGMLLLVGFNLINNVFSRSSQIDYLKFRRALINSIDTVASDYNARQKIELSVPKGATSLCFVDMNHGPPSGGTSHPLINSYWSDSEYREQDDKTMVRNVFLVGSDFFASFRIDKLVIDHTDRYRCIDVRRSNVEFWAEGKSRTVTVEKVVA